MENEQFAVGLYWEFMELADEMSNFTGTNYIYELWNRVDQGIHPTQLYHLYQQDDVKYVDNYQDRYYFPALHSAYYREPELPIEITDQQTLNEVRARLKAVVMKRDLARENNDHATAEDCQDEIDRLTEYNQDCITPRGKIRFIGSQRRKNISLISRAVKYFIKTIEPEHPRLARYLEQHVVIGPNCYWSSEPRIIPIRDHQSAAPKRPITKSKPSKPSAKSNKVDTDPKPLNIPLQAQPLRKKAAGRSRNATSS